MPRHFANLSVMTELTIEYVVPRSLIERLQITTAYPLWFDSVGNPLNGGHQFRLHMEKRTAQGSFMGSGPFDRRDGAIIHNEDANTWDEIEKSRRLGLIEAFRTKAAHGRHGINLLVHSVRYYESVPHFDRFSAIVEAAAVVVYPARFSKVIVVDYGDGFMWSRPPATPVGCRLCRS
jgi:hypothetical protein